MLLLLLHKRKKNINFCNKTKIMKTEYSGSLTFYGCRRTWEFNKSLSPGKFLLLNKKVISTLKVLLPHPCNLALNCLQVKKPWIITSSTPWKFSSSNWLVPFANKIRDDVHGLVLQVQRLLQFYWNPNLLTPLFLPSSLDALLSFCGVVQRIELETLLESCFCISATEDTDDEWGGGYQPRKHHVFLRAIKPEGSDFQDTAGAVKEARVFGELGDTINSCERISTGEMPGADTESFIIVPSWWQLCPFLQSNFTID